MRNTEILLSELIKKQALSAPAVVAALTGTGSVLGPIFGFTGKVIETATAGVPLVVNPTLKALYNLTKAAVQTSLILPAGAGVLLGGLTAKLTSPSLNALSIHEQKLLQAKLKTAIEEHKRKTLAGLVSNDDDFYLGKRDVLKGVRPEKLDIASLQDIEI